MPTKQPTPPPPKPTVTAYDLREYLMISALEWRRLDLQKSELAARELDNMRWAIDQLNKHRSDAPTSPPPPRKR
jgi:hypothetical protein